MSKTRPAKAIVITVLDLNKGDNLAHVQVAGPSGAWAGVLSRSNADNFSGTILNRVALEICEILDWNPIPVCEHVPRFFEGHRYCSKCYCDLPPEKEPEGE